MRSGRNASAGAAAGSASVPSAVCPFPGCNCVLTMADFHELKDEEEVTSDKDHKKVFEALYFPLCSVRLISVL